MVDGRIEALDTPATLKKMYEAINMDEVFLKLARAGKNKIPIQSTSHFRRETFG